jgi:hypothetical protein
MTTTKKQPRDAQEAYLDPEDYPAWWNWDEDGDLCAGTFVRFTQGFSEYGNRTIVVLLVDEVERSIWLHEMVLFDEFRREVLRRESRELDSGENIVIRRLEKQKTKDGKRTFRGFRVLFPDQPQPTTSDLLKLDEEPQQKPVDEKPAPDDGDLPF